MSSKEIGKGIIIPDTSFYEVENILCYGKYDPFPFGFSFIRDFFELCSIVEAIVLYDEIYTYIEEQGLIWHCSLFGKILENEKILKKAPSSSVGFVLGIDYFERDKILQELKEKLFLEHEKKDFAKREFNVSIFMFEDMLREDIRQTHTPQLSYKPLCIRDMLRPLNSIEIEVQSELYRVYDKLSKKMKKIQMLRFKKGYPYRIFIPPIPALILDRVDDFSEIPEITLELRDEFKEVRNKFREFQRIFADDKYTLREVIKTEREIKDITESLLEEKTDIDESRIALFKNFSVFLVKFLLKNEIDYNFIYETLSNNTINWINNRLKTNSSLFLLSLKKKYKNIENYGKLLHKVFGYKITRNDIAVWEYYNVIRENGIKFDDKSFFYGLQYFPPIRDEM